jgi:hypothetical protein
MPLEHVWTWHSDCNLAAGHQAVAARFRYDITAMKKDDSMRFFTFVVSIALVVSVGLLAQEPVEKKTQKAETEGVVPQVTVEKPISFWMEQKLGLSKSMLESLTKGDFKALEQDAEKMRLLGKIEALVRRKNSDYRQQMRNFEFANQELVRMSKRKNVEGALLAFNQMTSSCVACHVLLREGVD